jgi:hypothetical protein
MTSLPVAQDHAHPPTIASPLVAGGRFPVREFSVVSGEWLHVPDPRRLVHLQFRRFAGCPVCVRHLDRMALRAADIAAAGIREIVFFYSTAEEVRRHTSGLPFGFVADPDRLVYREFGVHSSPRALLDPRAWGAIVLSVAYSLISGRPLPPLVPPDRFGLPAEALIAPDGRVVAAKYGVHVNDQWSVDELLALAGTTPSRRSA